MSFIEKINRLYGELPAGGLAAIVELLGIEDRNRHTGTQSFDTIVETLDKKIMTKEERNKLALVDLNNPPAHIHSLPEVSGLESALASKSDVLHQHDALYYTRLIVDAMLASKSDTTHNHNGEYYTEVEINQLLQGYATVLHTYTKTEVVGLLLAKEDAAMKGQPSGYAELDGAGKLIASQLPSLSIVDVFEASSEASMLLLSNVGVGDICIRSDLSINNAFMLKQTPASDLQNWIQLSYSATVASVNGQMGIVVLTKSDIGLGNVDNTSDANKPISIATQAALDGKSATGHNHDLLYEPKNANIQEHIISDQNPHGVTAEQVGLGNADNTSDLNKPLSTVAAAAFSTLQIETFIDFKI